MENITPEDDLARRTLRTYLYDLTHEIQDENTYNMSLKLLFDPEAAVEELLSFMKNDIGDAILTKLGIQISDRWKTYQ